MIRNTIVLLLQLLLSRTVVLVECTISPPQDSDLNKCVGIQPDFSRIEDVDSNYLQEVQSPQSDRQFLITSKTTITRADNNQVLSDRVRLKESIKGVHIHGADVVVSFEGCQSGICPLTVQGLVGKTFKTINVTDGYVPTASVANATAKLMETFHVPAKAVGDLLLKVFAATTGDYLAYFTDVLVENQGDVRYYYVIIDAHSLEILSICSLVISSRRRYLRSNNNSGEQLVSANGIRCESCAPDSQGMAWSDTYSNCSINSLYLNNTGREAICVDGTDENGQNVYEAGPVPSLHWGGTNDCKSTTDSCDMAVLPQCRDAISDVQYGAIRTLQYLQDYLGVMGGLAESSENPVPIQANAHYGNRYCNAFYRSSVNTVMFGDCDCSYWTPLVSIDIVAHEITHGVTKHSSSLEYQYQSGGLNEGFSDIVGATVEFLLNDSKNTPDFDVGEMLGNKLRSMEFPEENGRGIASVCQYNKNLDVHTSAGPLNKAFVASVRACQANGCSNERGCTLLLGSIFTYGNIQSLTTYSGYVDAAKATCNIVQEYYVARSPDTLCIADEVVNFIRQGWLLVNVAVEESCNSTICCSNDCPSILPVPSVSTASPAPTQTTPSPTSGPVPTSPSTLSPTAPAGPQTQTQTHQQSQGGAFILAIFKIIRGLFATFHSVLGG